MIELKAFELNVGMNLETNSPLVVGVDNKLNSRIMSGEEVYLKSEVDAAIEELKNKLEDAEATAYAESVDAGMENYNLKRSLWIMTAEWAEAMGLASCNIAIKLSAKDRFFYHDEANREKDIKKYKHRQVVFYKYADYCRKKAEEYK